MDWKELWLKLIKSMSTEGLILGLKSDKIMEERKIMIREELKIRDTK